MVGAILCQRIIFDVFLFVGIESLGLLTFLSDLNAMHLHIHTSRDWSMIQTHPTARFSQQVVLIFSFPTDLMQEMDMSSHMSKPKIWKIEDKNLSM